MTTRAELEAALEKAEIERCTAHQDLETTRAGRTKADADWDRIITDRRGAVADRRKGGTLRNRAFPGRRVAAADRRNLDSGIGALSKAVAHQHQVYLARSKAEADCAAAEARLNAATAERDRALAALDGLRRPDQTIE